MKEFSVLNSKIKDPSSIEKHFKVLLKSTTYNLLFYLSTNNGRLIIADIISGKVLSILKIDNTIISRPFVLNQNIFVIKENAIIRLK